MRYQNSTYMANYKSVRTGQVTPIEITRTGNHNLAVKSAQADTLEDTGRVVCMHDMVNSERTYYANGAEVND